MFLSHYQRLLNNICYLCFCLFHCRIIIITIDLNVDLMCRNLDRRGGVTGLVGMEKVVNGVLTQQSLLSEPHNLSLSWVFSFRILCPHISSW